MFELPWVVVQHLTVKFYFDKNTFLKAQLSQPIPHRRFSKDKKKALSISYRNTSF